MTCFNYLSQFGWMMREEECVLNSLLSLLLISERSTHQIGERRQKIRACYASFCLAARHGPFTPPFASLDVSKSNTNL